MLKQLYRIIILIIVFIASLYYFSRDIKEVVFNIDNTTKMEAVSYPLVTIKTGDTTINLLHGYSSNLDANKVRETVTPVNLDQTFEVLINEENYVIKKLNYEVREFSGNSLIESDSVSVFEEAGEQKTAKIKLKSQLQEEKEYAVKITLITSKSEKMYYFQRIKMYDNAHLKEKLDFVLDFHNSIMDKVKADEVERYLETSGDADNTSLAYVNINSSLELVTWGNLKPTILTDIVPEIVEIYEDTASIALNYFVQAEVADQMESYRVTEFYRVRYGTDRMYLLNYERHMESIFDIKLASVSQNELKLGITTDLELPYTAGEDKTKLAFIRNRELWFYDLTSNETTKVFSFRQEKPDYTRDMYDQHNIRILNMDVEGNIDFMVYGYMNRGQYEGKVAIILYRFVRAESRIEELVYIPVDEPYQLLKENLGSLSYLNSKEVYYFQAYNSIYSFDLITKKLNLIAENVGQEQVMVLEDISYVVWQETADISKSKQINIMDLESGRIDNINAKEGYNIRLLGMIDSNIIYGYVKEGDISSMIDGSILVPLSTLEIASIDKKVLKSYNKSGYYVSGIEVKDNIIELKRVKRLNEGGGEYFTSADPDYIMNQESEEPALINSNSRVTDQALKEYYMTLPSGFVMAGEPKVLSTVNTVIAEDPTVRLENTTQPRLTYFAYVEGGIKGAYENASEAIEVAKEGIGVVINNSNQIVWERGVKLTKNTISRFETMSYQATPGNTIENCLQQMLAYQGVAVTRDELGINNSSAYEVLKKYSKNTPVRLTGITLDDALYYVSKGRPVLAMTDSNDAMLIYGYDTFNIMVVNPATGSRVKIGIQDSTQMFEAAGNVFLSYLEE
ncbi:MAG: putative rane protein [Herbinix sp.]|nr:putative rane protein [Herbinix sp.]